MMRPALSGGQQPSPSPSSMSGGVPATPRLSSVGSRGGSQFIKPGGSICAPIGSGAQMRVPSADDAARGSRCSIGSPFRKEAVYSTTLGAGSSGSQSTIRDIQAVNATVDELREMILREVRDSNSQLSHRMDDMLAEVRGELSNMQQECSSQRREIESLRELQAACYSRHECLERGLAEESEARYDAERAHISDLQALREQVVSEMLRMQEVLPEVQRSLGVLQRRVSNLHVDRIKDNGTDDVEDPSDADCEVLDGDKPLVARDAEEMREALDHVLDARLLETRNESTAQISELERRITEEWTGLRGWVDAAVVAVVNRISSLECALQSEMAERSARMQEVTEGVAFGSEQMRQLQDEVDKLTTETRRNVQSTQKITEVTANSESPQVEGEHGNGTEHDISTDGGSGAAVLDDGAMRRNSPPNASMVGTQVPPKGVTNAAVPNSTTPRTANPGFQRAQSYGGVLPAQPNIVQQNPNYGQPVQVTTTQDLWGDPLLRSVPRTHILQPGNSIPNNNRGPSPPPRGTSGPTNSTRGCSPPRGGYVSAPTTPRTNQGQVIQMRRA